MELGVHLMNCGFNFAVLYVVNKEDVLVMEYKSSHRSKKKIKAEKSSFTIMANSQDY